MVQNCSCFFITIIKNNQCWHLFFILNSAVKGFCNYSQKMFTKPKMLSLSCQVMILSLLCWALRSWTERHRTYGQSSVSSYSHCNYLITHFEMCLMIFVVLSNLSCSPRSCRIRCILQKRELDPLWFAFDQHTANYRTKLYSFPRSRSKMFVLCSQPITNSPPKWMAELESEDIEMLKG